MALEKLRFVSLTWQAVDGSSTSPSNYSAISINSIHNVRCTEAQYIYLSTLTPWARVACGVKTSISRRLTLAGQFLTRDWKMWVVAVLLDTISKNMLSQTDQLVSLLTMDRCKERKPCVKWINDNNFLAIPDFWSEKHWERARVYTHLKTGTGKCKGCFRFRQGIGLRKTSDIFGRLRTSSVTFGNDRAVFKNPSTPRIKVSRLYLKKSWHV